MPKKKIKKTKPAASSTGSGQAKKSKTQKPVGIVTHYYSNLEVAIVKFNRHVKAGARLKFKGATTDFEETIKSMQFDHEPVTVAKKGKEVGIKVKDKVREGDEVFDATKK